MASRRVKSNERGPHERDANANTPTQQDEADILEEVGAVRDEETGTTLVDEATIRKLGAVDATSVRANRRLSQIVDKKRAGMTGVPFNSKDPLETYETILKYWPADTITIQVKRLIGGAVQTITSGPLTAAALYEAIRVIHGQYAETEYEVKFHGVGTNEYRGTSRITMPDTRPATAPQQGQQPMMYPPQYAPPPAQSPAPLDPSSMMTMMQQMIGVIDQMRSAAQPTPVAPASPVWQPPLPPQMPAPLAPGATPAEMMTWMQQMVGMVDQMRSTAQQPVASPPPPPQYQAPPPPSPSPQSSLIETMTMMEQMFEMFRKMQGPVQAPGQGPYRGPRPQYDARGDRGDASPQYVPPPQPPQRQPTPVEQLRESMTNIRTVVSAVREMNDFMPQREQQEAFSAPDADDDSPVRIIDAGPAKIVVDKKDGTLRGWETAYANLGPTLKWFGEQREAIQKETRERQIRQQAPRQQLAPGLVEVGPGYVPPPGYVAVEVSEQDLPPPPENVPPPIQPAAPAGRRTWGASTGSEGEDR